MTNGNGQALIDGLKERLNTKATAIPYVEPLLTLTSTGEGKLRAFLAWLKEQHEGETFSLRPREHALFGDKEFMAARLYAELMADIGREENGNENPGRKCLPKVTCPIKVDITFQQSLTPESGEHEGQKFDYGVVGLGARPLLYLLHMSLGGDDKADVKMKIATRD